MSTTPSKALDPRPLPDLPEWRITITPMSWVCATRLTTDIFSWMSPALFSSVPRMPENSAKVSMMSSPRPSAAQLPGLRDQVGPGNLPHVALQDDAYVVAFRYARAPQ